MPEPHRARGVARLASTLILALIVAACAGASTPSATPSASGAASPSASPGATPSPSSPAPSAEPTVSASPQPGSQEVVPSSPPQAVGAIEAVTLFTHCGFLPGRIDWAGSFWQETGREPTGGATGDPEDAGRMTLINETTARFESSTGTVVVLERVDGPVSLQPCD